ncbi:MAG: pyridoxal phosphate-dependent aminotransferase [bacterium]
MIPKFLEEKNFKPIVEINPDLSYLGTETAFDFGAKVMEVEQSKKFNQVYKFHVGDTGPKTPEPIIETAVKALRDKQTKYGHFLGYPQIRKNIAKYLSESRGVEIKAENIILQPGGKPAIELTMQTLLCPDDYVVGHNPGYPIYESLAKFYSKGKYIPWMAHYDISKERLEFSIPELEEIVKNQPKVKLLVLNTPQNPTGIMFTQAELEQIAELAKKYNFMILFDDIYDQITFDGHKHFSLLSIPGMLDRVINLNGFSKDYAMTGWRVGFIVAPEWVIEIFGRLAINKWTCVSRFSQIVAGAIFGDVNLDGYSYPSVRQAIEPILKENLIEYEKKGKFLVDALRLLRPYVVPNGVEGAFYDFPYIKELLNLNYVKNELNIKSDRDFVYWLLYERGIATLAGMDFGEGGKGFMRFSYAEDRNAHIIPGITHFIKTVIELIEKSGAELPLKMEEVDAKINDLKIRYFG